MLNGGLPFKATGAVWHPDWAPSAPFAFCPIFEREEDANAWNEQLFLGSAKVIEFPWDNTVVEVPNEEQG